MTETTTAVERPRAPAADAYALEPAPALADISPRAFRVGLAACAFAVAAFAVALLHAWPPHEDETLALFVGRGSLSSLLNIVTGERGGAPLHFLIAWAVAHLGGGIGALRLVSAACAVASVPVLGMLVTRLTDRRTALVATAIASASWVLLFHAIYGRMYSLFLLTSALSYIALLAALERGGRRRWVLWALAALATVATHPYGALVLGSQGLYVLLARRRLREALLAGGIVGLCALPFWRADLVLAGRFDVGVGGGGSKLGAPLPVLRYLRMVSGDFTVGYSVATAVVLVTAAVGALLLARARKDSALLVGAVIATPTLAFLVVSLGSSTSPESRHLIFALPFFCALVATALVALGRRRSVVLAATALAALLVAEVAWAWHKTPPLFTGEPNARLVARRDAAEWLAQTGRPNDVLFGYDPLFLGAWERDRPGASRIVVPRADATLALRVLAQARRPLGRGVWVLDASDTNNFVVRLTIAARRPSPLSDFESRAWGPFLVIRSLQPTRTPLEFLRQTAAVEALGQELLIGDADINLATARTGIRRLDGEPHPR